MIRLDTNVVIAASNRRNAAVARRMGEALTQGASIGLPVIVLFELRYGYARSDRKLQSRRCGRSFSLRGSPCFPSRNRTPATPATFALTRKNQVSQSGIMIISSPRRRVAAARHWSRRTAVSSSACRG